MTIATGRPGAWHVAAPALVGDVTTFLARLRVADEPTVLGVDFPLGLPRAYAARHVTAPDFLSFLTTLAHRPAFFQVCADLASLSADRPFYPARGAAGMTRLSHAQALGLPDATALSRACDRATAERPAGAPVFWTLGANQSGKAAIAAWRDMLLPALASPHPPALWPFEGHLATLLAPGRVVIAETYPAEALRHLGLRLPGSKRRQDDRAALAPGLHAAMARLGASGELPLDSGFGPDPAGEDRFDSTLGLLCVLQVLAGTRPDFIPDDPWIRRWEGWVLGQTALPRLGAPVA